ncbi:MAG: hypothetical protein ACHQXJ_02595, partial [Nitrososphaerales archaeon]
MKKQDKSVMRFPKFRQIVQEYFLNKTKIYLHEDETFLLNDGKTKVVCDLGSQKYNVGIICLSHLWGRIRLCPMKYYLNGIKHF